MSQSGARLWLDLRTLNETVAGRPDEVLALCGNAVPVPLKHFDDDGLVAGRRTSEVAGLRAGSVAVPRGRGRECRCNGDEEGELRPGRHWVEVRLVRE